MPLLRIWLEHLEKHGINEVLVNTHWHHDKVDAFLKEYKSERLKIIPFHEPTLLGSAGTMLANKDWVNDGAPFFILYGDNLTDVDLGKMLSFHLQHGLTFTLGVFKAEDPKRCGIAEIEEDGLVSAFVEKPAHPRSDKAAAGVYVTDNRIYEFFPEEESIQWPLDLGFHIIPRLVGEMKAYFLNDFLMDIGTPISYRDAQLRWMERKGK
jgi:mannose-1-phosphate guanylyltransferase